MTQCPTIPPNLWQLATAPHSVKNNKLCRPWHSSHSESHTLTKNPMFNLRFSPWGIWDSQSRSDLVFSPSTLVWPCRHHSTNTPFSFQPMTPYNLRNWQHLNINHFSVSQTLHTYLKILKVYNWKIGIWMRLFSFHLCNSEGLHLPNQICIPGILVHPQFIPLVSLCIQLNYVALFSPYYLRK